MAGMLLNDKVSDQVHLTILCIKSILLKTTVMLSQVNLHAHLHHQTFIHYSVYLYLFDENFLQWLVCISILSVIRSVSGVSTCL